MIRRILVIVLLCLLTRAGAEELPSLEGYRVCVDPGHQASVDDRKEPVSPFDRSNKKAKVAGGAIGLRTRVRESQRNLEIALKLAEQLEAQGAQVLLTRTVEEVNVSNIERARMANEFKADVFLRLHCNYSEDPKRKGLRVYVPIVSANRLLGLKKADMLAWADTLGQYMMEESGAPSYGCVANNEYSGNNWAQMPSFLIEMGYMSNEADDRLLGEEDYQQGLIRGLLRFVATLPKDVYRQQEPLTYP